MPKETSDLAAQVRKMSIREAINFLADALQERQEIERGERGPKGDRGEDSTIPGPPGPPGEDSTIPGPPGPPGQSIVGPAGKNGRDVKIAVGSVSVGETASVSLREKDGMQFLDFVLPRGEQGPQGVAGKDGVPGVSLDAVVKTIDNILAILSRVSDVRQLLGESGADVVQQLVDVKNQVLVIASDPRYARMDGQRTEIVRRIQQHYIKPSKYD